MAPADQAFLLILVPSLARQSVSHRHRQDQHEADDPDFHDVRVGAAKHAVAYPVDDDPDQQPDAGQDFIQDEPPVLADNDVAQPEDDEAADRAAPDVELVQHGLAEPAVQRGVGDHDV